MQKQQRKTPARTAATASSPTGCGDRHDAAAGVGRPMTTIFAAVAAVGHGPC